MDAIVLLGHGSRLESSNQAFAEVAEKVAERLPEIQVEFAFLQLAEPGLDSVVAGCVRGGATRLGVVPFFLLPGAHVQDDIPKAVERLKEQFPGVSFSVSSTLGDHPHLIDAVVGRSREALP